VLLWTAIVVVGWAIPVAHALAAHLGLLLLAAIILAGFSVFAFAYPVWVVAILACFYIPLMYIVVLYVEAAVGYRLYGTAF
jgi:hypothetical protein